MLRLPHVGVDTVVQACTSSVFAKVELLLCRSGSYGDIEQAAGLMPSLRTLLLVEDMDVKSWPGDSHGDEGISTRSLYVESGFKKILNAGDVNGTVERGMLMQDLLHRNHTSNGTVRYLTRAENQVHWCCCP